MWYSTTSSLLISTDMNTYDVILQILGETVNVNRAYLFQIQDNGLKMSNTFEWCAPETDPQMNALQNLETSIFPWWMQRMQDGENIVVKDVDRLPNEASVEKEMLETQNIQSLAVVPIKAEDQTLLGFMGFDDTEKRREEKRMESV